ncbi:MAG: ATP-binding protein [Acidobacteriota bacterium]
MLTQPTINTLRSMKLNGMADAYTQQLEQPDVQHLSFDERLGLLVDRETTYRESRRQRRLLQLARLRQNACVEDINYQHTRGLDRSAMAMLITCDWMRSHQNLHITGPTGTGKTSPHNYPHRKTR